MAQRHGSRILQRIKRHSQVALMTRPQSPGQSLNARKPSMPVTIAHLPHRSAPASSMPSMPAAETSSNILVNQQVQTTTSWESTHQNTQFGQLNRESLPPVLPVVSTNRPAIQSPASKPVSSTSQPVVNPGYETTIPPVRTPIPGVPTSNPQNIPTVSPATDGNAKDENGWRRLQSIFQRHQEKEAAENQLTQSSSDQLHEISRETEKLSSSPSVQADTTIRPIPPRPAIVELEPASSTPPPVIPIDSSQPIREIPPTEEEISSVQMETIPPNTQDSTESFQPSEESTMLYAPREIMTSSVPMESSAEMDAETYPETESLAPIQPTPEKSIPLQAVQNTVSAPIPVPMNASSPVPPSPAEITSSLHPSSEETLIPGAPENPVTRPAISPQEPIPTSQPLPLESVWQVERRQPPAVDAQIPPVSVEQPEPILQVSAEAEEVRRILDTVTANQPTDSRIEVITPLRPRPSIPTPPAPRPAQKPVEQQTPADESSLPPIAPPITGQPAPALQTASARQPAMIQTEIGPLPADLWTLLSKPAPAPIAEPQKHNIAPIETPAIVSIPSAEPEPESAPPQPIIQPSIPTMFIQRSVDDSAEPVTASPVSSEPAQAAPGPPPSGQVDVDDLARRVYSDIKRRLGIEIERFRHRN